ncbi:hypothetical protein OKW41_006492 [Paraburkholderia sp. UCT70]
MFEAFKRPFTVLRAKRVEAFQLKYQLPGGPDIRLIIDQQY